MSILNRFIGKRRVPKGKYQSVDNKNKNRRGNSPKKIKRPPDESLSFGMFTYIHPPQNDKGICNCRNLSVKPPCVYVCPPSLQNVGLSHLKQHP